MNTLENILNQSFQEEVNRHNNREISRSEENNVDSLFNSLEGINTECNICYSDEKCIQCYQCEFKYCKVCMSKVISEFTKCSACQCNFINNYSLIKDKNIEIQQSRNKQNHINYTLSDNANNDNANNDNANNDNAIVEYYDYGIDDELDDVAIAIQNSLDDFKNHKPLFNNLNSHTTVNDIRNYDISDDLYIDFVDKPSINIVEQTTPTTHPINNIKSQLETYIEELVNNEILPFNITSLKTKNYKPNFTCNYDKINYLQVYYSHDKILPKIELNYKIYNTIFQSRLRILLIKLLDFPHKFNNVWAQIALIMNNCKNNSRNNVKNSKRVDELDMEQKKLLEDIRKLIFG
jgi:hypothetical protein